MVSGNRIDKAGYHSFAMTIFETDVVEPIILYYTNLCVVKADSVRCPEGGAMAKTAMGTLQPTFKILNPKVRYAEETTWK